MDRYLKLFAVIDLAGGRTLFEHAWRWPEGAKRSDVPNLVANLVKYAQEIGDGTLRGADFEPKAASTAASSSLAGPTSSATTKMICVKEGSLVGALFYEQPEPTGHDGRDSAAAHAIAEYASGILREAYAGFATPAQHRAAAAAAAAAASDGPSLAAFEGSGMADEDESKGGAMSTKPDENVELFRQKLLAIAARVRHPAESS